MDPLRLAAACLEGERRLDVAVGSRRPQDANSWRNHAENRLPGYALSMTFRLGREPNTPVAGGRAICTGIVRVSRPGHYPPTIWTSTTALVALGLWLAQTDSVCRADEVDARVAAIAAVGPQGKGSADARKACRELAMLGPEVLPRLLSAMDTPNIVAANWFRAAYEQIVARELARAKPKFPVAAFQAYVRDSKRQGRARRLALDLLDRIDPSFKPAALPTLLDDPEFRDDAVALVLKSGDACESQKKQTAAKQAYESAFQHARNVDQVTTAARKLEAFGEKVSIQAHLGFVTDWSLIGPFPAAGMSGYRTPFPPETVVNLGLIAQTADKKELPLDPSSNGRPLWHRRSRPGAGAGERGGRLRLHRD